MARLIYSEVARYYSNHLSGDSFAKICRDSGVHEYTMHKYIRRYLAGDEMYFVTDTHRVMAISHVFSTLKLCECVNYYENHYNMEITKSNMMRILYNLGIDYFKVSQVYDRLAADTKRQLIVKIISGKYKNMSTLANEFGVSGTTVRNLRARYDQLQDKVVK